MIPLYIACWLTMQPLECVDQTMPMLMVEEPASDAVVLKRPDGTPIWVNPHAIAFIREPLPGELHDAGKTVIVFSNGAKQAVVETVDEIKELVRREQGRGGYP